MKKRIALALILLGLSSQAFAVATFGAVSLTVDASRFYFDVVVQDADPGDFNVFRISSEACAIGCPDKERIEFNFNGTDGSFTYGPEVQTFDSPTYDRWQDGVITDLSLVNIGGFDWRVSGSVAHGADPYVSGDTVSQLALRTTSDRYLNDVAITQVVPEVLAFSPSPADFGDVVVGKAGGPIIVTVTNTDAFDEVSFLPWWSDGVLPPFFVAPEIDLPAGMAPCEAEVEPGDACGFAVRFVPTATGPAQQTLQFLSLDEVPVVLGSVDLQGNGIELITDRRRHGVRPHRHADAAEQRRRRSRRQRGWFVHLRHRPVGWFRLRGHDPGPTGRADLRGDQRQRHDQRGRCDHGRSRLHDATAATAAGRAGVRRRADAGSARHGRTRRVAAGRWIDRVTPDGLNGDLGAQMTPRRVTVAGFFSIQERLRAADLDHRAATACGQVAALGDEALHVLAGHEVDHAGDRFRTVDRGSAVLQNLDPFRRGHRDRVSASRTVTGAGLSMFERIRR